MCQAGGEIINCDTSYSPLCTCEKSKAVVASVGVAKEKVLDQRKKVYK